MTKRWLVELGLCGWITLPKGMPPVLCYMEVCAEDEYTARHLAWAELELRFNYTTSLRRDIFAVYGATNLNQFCVRDAVEL